MTPTNYAALVGRAGICLSVFLLIAPAACGDDASPGDGDGTPDGGEPGQDAAPSPDGGGGSEDGGGPGGRPTCATATALAKETAVNAIVMLDHSGSMGDQTGGEQNLATRWIPVTEGLKRFFNDPKSVGLSATLRDYPQLEADDRPVCSPNVYRSPRVPLTPLPNGNFTRFMETSPPPLGGSAIAPALQGAIDLAKETAGRRPGERSVVVLVTDGLPDSERPPGPCNTTYPDLAKQTKAARDGKPSIPTIVVGVGTTRFRPEIEAVATSGGTQAIWLEPGNPGKLATELATKLNGLHDAALACSIALPKPPDGESLDTKAVKVVVTTAASGPSTLPYNEACTGNQGWHYDNLDAPKNIVLCTTACAGAQSDKTAKLAADFACVGK